MIKKSVYENDIIYGMEAELVKQGSQINIDHIEKAADYLNSAAEIFDDLGMTSNANEVLSILSKIANKHVIQMPAIKALIGAGMHPNDMLDINHSPVSKARVNSAFRELGYSDNDIIGFIGHKHFMNKKDTDDFTKAHPNFSGLHKIWEWIKDPIEVSPSSELKPGDEFSIATIGPKSGNEHHHYDDKHSNGLTSKKMEENIKEHGVIFNIFDAAKADDLGDLDVDDTLSVSDQGVTELHDFEDEVDSKKSYLEPAEANFLSRMSKKYS